MPPPAPRAPWLPPRDVYEDLPALTLGTGGFGSRVTTEDASRLVSAALDGGIRSFETAPHYGDGAALRELGQFLRGRWHDVAIAVHVLASHDTGGTGLVPRVESALARLGADAIDLLYLEAPTALPLELMYSVERLMSEGKVRHWGVSHASAWSLLKLDKARAETGVPPPIAQQCHFSLLVQRGLTNLESPLEARRLHSAVCHVLEGGRLGGRGMDALLGSVSGPGTGSVTSQAYPELLRCRRVLIETFGTVAREEGMTLAELALTWAANSSDVDSIVLGPSTVEQLASAAEACARGFPDSARAKVDAILRAYFGPTEDYQP